MEDNQTRFFFEEEEEEEEDVTVAEEQTAPESSTETQTADGTNVENNETPTETGDSVPEVNRFAERARKAEKAQADLEARLKEVETRMQPAPDQQSEAVKQQLKALGFVSQDEVEARIRQQREDARVEQELNSLETRYSGTDGRPKFDRQKVINYALDHGIANPELAYKAMHERELLDWHVKQAVTKTGGVKTEGSDGSGSTQVGTTNEDLRTAIASGDQGALRTFLKRLNK